MCRMGCGGRVGGGMGIQDRSIYHIGLGVKGLVGDGMGGLKRVRGGEGGIIIPENSVEVGVDR